MEVKRKDNFILYHNQFPMIEELEDEEVGEVIKSIFKYTMDGEIAEYPRGSGKSMLFKSIKNSIDVANKSYYKKCEENRKNALKRWKKIFYDKQDFTKESFESYCIENNIDENFEEILHRQKELVDNQEYDIKYT